MAARGIARSDKRAGGKGFRAARFNVIATPDKSHFSISTFARTGRERNSRNLSSESASSFHAAANDGLRMVNDNDIERKEIRRSG
jgi:hypothetical protein